MSKVKKVKYKTTPKLNVHKYVCAVYSVAKSGVVTTKYHYCTNREAVRALKRKLKADQILEVFEAQHSFKGAWSK